MTANRSNYRVKVDLSKYHEDARRFSWIYVDSANILFVRHLKQHIAQIFGTREPFHLLLNGKEYLPPIEDARVIKENELIAVIPGTGILDKHDITMSMSSPEKQETIIQHAERKEEARNGDCRKEKSKMSMDVEQNDSKSLNNSMVDISAIEATMYHSMREVTEMETTQDSKATDDNVTDNCSTTDAYGVPGQKRKRVRRKRSKNTSEATLPEKVDAKIPSARVYKPKILPKVLPAGKHIHFDTAEDGISDAAAAAENGSSDPPAENKKRVAASPPAIAKSRVGSLSTLLALRQCSTPLTFLNKKAKHVDNEPADVAKIEPESRDNAEDEPRPIQETPRANGNASVAAAKLSEEPSDYTSIDPEKYPSLQMATEINDIIAFKILRITNEYTPEVSDYIVAKTIDWCPKKTLFTFQILKGHTHIQTPLGKFSLPDDESVEQICETANFNFSQLIDPRLIYRK